MWWQLRKTLGEVKTAGQSVGDWDMEHGGSLVLKVLEKVLRDDR